MTSEQWQKAKTVLDEALEKPPDKRAAFVEEACADDPAVRREVEALLRASDAADGFFGGFERGAVEAIAGMEPVSDVGEEVGAYRIEQEIARGGMGTVYLAERADGQFQQRVAIKVLHRGLETSYLVRRFAQERQILASLNHPNIARLLDGGVTADGRPYFVMEYVEGTTITDYCDAHRLGVKARLRLFMDVVRAVQHAHQRLVIHRDLKPSNILVTEAGAVKLLDFGVAKLLDAEALGVGTQPVTRRGQRWMTPEYASPEQIREEAVTTAADVYTLGLLLYELLSGCRPYAFGTRGTREVEQAVLGAEVPEPSAQLTRATEALARDTGAPATPEAISKARGTSPGRLRSRLRGDLDTIVLKALRKEPARRYASAEALADDLTRYFDGLPVHARRETVRYRVRKFLSRHRVGAAAAAVIALLLVGYAATVTTQARRIAEERDRAQREAAKAAEVSTFLQEMFRAGDPGELPGDTLTAQAMLARGVERIATLERQPAVRAEMLTVIGNAYTGLGLYAQATPLLRRAVAVRDSLHRGPAPSLARSLNFLGLTLRQQGDYAEAETVFRRALAMQRALQDGRDAPGLASSANDLGTVLRMRGDYAAAEPLLREALAMRRRLLVRGDGRVDSTDVGSSLNNLALLLLDEGDNAAAEPLFRQALAIRRAVHGDAAHPSLAINLYNVALTLHNQGNHAAAEPLYREVVMMDRMLFGPRHPEVGVDLSKLAGLLRDKGDYAAADSVYEAALDILQDVLPEGHPRTAVALVGRGALWALQGQPAAAEPLLREGHGMFEAAFGPDHWLTANAESWLGRCFAQQGRLDDAEPLLLGAYTTLEEVRGVQDVYTQRALRHLTSLYEAKDRPDRAGDYRTLLTSDS